MECDKGSFTLQTTRMMKTHTDKPEPEETFPRKSYQKLTCDLCSFNSLSECHLKDHQLEQDELFTEKSFQSEYCGALFSLKEHLKVHFHRRHSNQTQGGKSNQDSCTSTLMDAPGQSLITKTRVIAN